MHLFLYGDSGVGKSTIIQNALSAHGLSPRGFLTTKQKEPDGSFRLYLNAAGEPPRYSSETLAADWRKNGPLVCYPETFNRQGLYALSDIPEKSLVLMDEIGRFERDAALFSARILEILNMDAPVIGVFQDRDTPLLHAIRAHERVEALHVTLANRNDISKKVMRFLNSI
ncbi:nucleoside-triphosphatase [Christensenellaceae bacterium OttesenSCG-928-M15]|nr:nucleoside-triphosphatase [Christensenellaceae bacterium OttesenSCG-928-M15]